jgi:RNA-directed DNA polymerase
MKLNSVNSLARLLGMSLVQLVDFATNADSMYSPFVSQVKTKRRTIDRPSRSLNDLQRKIYDLLLRDHVYSEFAFGGVPRRSLRDAVRAHSSRPLVIQVDVKSFYPSISDKSVFDVWRRLGHGTRVSALLTRLTTYKRHLPQGAATSMALANLFMEPVDARVFATLKLAFEDVKYTRWVDDMIFSGTLDASAVLSVAARHLREVGLRAHRAREKRRVLPRDARQEILGTVVNNGVGLSRRRKRLARAIVHTAQRFGGNVDSVKGHIQHLRSFHSTLADQLEDSLRLAPVLFDKGRL